MTLALLAGIVMTPQAIVVDPTVRYQKWDGFGTSLCWWAHVVGSYTTPVREDIMQKFFGYLKFNVVRYNIPGGENPEHHHMEYRAQLPGYLGPDGKWDWNMDASQRWVLQRAKELGADRFEAFSNSPPYWMTASKCAAGGEKGQENLPEANVNAFAKYLVDVNEHFRTDWGITFETLEPLNEPYANWWPSGGRQEGCRVNIGMPQARIIEAVGKYLKAANSPTKIAASDENTIDLAVKSWDALPPSTKDLVWRINAHHYGGSQQLELAQRAAEAKKRVWMSEEGDNDASGLTMAERIVKDVRDMKASAWVYWQAIDNKPSNWGMLDIDLNGRGQDYVTHKKFYVMANFSRFIRPGSTLVDIADSHSVAAIYGRELVIVSVNKGPARDVSFDLSRFKRLGKSGDYYRTSANEELVKGGQISIANSQFTTNQPENSVTTYVLKAG